MSSASHPHATALLEHDILIAITHTYPATTPLHSFLAIPLSLHSLSPHSMSPPLLGSFSDRSDEREQYDSELEAVFGGKGHEMLEMNAQDGTFFMR